MQSLVEQDCALFLFLGDSSLSEIDNLPIRQFFLSLHWFLILKKKNALNHGSIQEVRGKKKIMGKTPSLMKTESASKQNTEQKKEKRKQKRTKF